MTDALFTQIGAEVWGNAEPLARFTQLAIEVWAKVPHVAVKYVWPFRLLPPVNQRSYRVGNVKLGPVAIDGAQQQVTRTDGGGLWRTDCIFRPQSIDQIRALRAWDSYLDSGVQDFIMPLIDLHFAPRDIVGGRLRRPGPTPTASDYFGEVAAYDAPIVEASLFVDADLRATTVHIQLYQGSPLKGGEHFSLYHDTKGWRLYTIARVRSVDSDDVYAVDIRPPIREAISVGSPLPVAEFDIPRCLMRLHPDSATALNVGVTNFRIGADINVSFIESFEAP